MTPQEAALRLREWYQAFKNFGKGNERTVHEFLEAADLIESLAVQVPRWVSVEERLPEERLCVSVYIQEDGGAYWIETAFRRDGKWRIQGEYVIDRNITHWMPLPSTEGLHDD